MDETYNTTSHMCDVDVYHTKKYHTVYSVRERPFTRTERVLDVASRYGRELYQGTRVNRSILIQVLHELETVYHITPSYAIGRDILSLLYSDIPSPDMVGTLRDASVYLMCPVPLFATAAYDGLYFATRQCTETISSPRSLFEDSRDWLHRFPHDLPTMTAAVLVASQSAIVGRGCYVEWEYFSSHSMPVYLYHTGMLTPVQTMTIVGRGRDWTDYARVEVVKGGTQWQN